MSDDIVKRLRAYNIGNIAHEASSHMEETLYEAADEIERLRAIAFCRTCEPADTYYCIKHRQDEEGKA